MTRYLSRPLDPRASCPTEGLGADDSNRNLSGSLSRKASFLANQSDVGAGPPPRVTTPSGTHVAFKVPSRSLWWAEDGGTGAGPPSQGGAHHFLSHFISQS